ncbi:MAG: ferredoxin--NADP(+) reductase [Proteobacteria bacterium]|nr:MAG: ferredoxin--NADP(+) reductase [Pseudomonadota bacterium]
MSKFSQEEVLYVKHWNEKLFSFKTTRSSSLRFESGEFVMIGLEHKPRPIMRAYSIASANYEDHLEFYSIKAPGGELTSRLQHLKVGDTVLVGRKPTGTLLIRDMNPGENLFLFATGTGLAPFLSLVQDPAVYEHFKRVILFHGVRIKSELGYYDWFTKELPEHEYIGDMVKNQLTYYPSVTREEFRNQGRMTDLIRNGQLCERLGLPPLNPKTDRAMLCGSPSMLAEMRTVLDELNFEISPKTGMKGDYLIERAFVE